MKCSKIYKCCILTFFYYELDEKGEIENYAKIPEYIELLYLKIGHFQEDSNVF